MRLSATGLALIIAFEGFSSTVYDDGVGVRTIGYGTTAADGPLPSHLTEPQARALLVKRLDRRYEPPIRELFAAPGPLHGLYNQHRYDALVSLVYNLGPGAVPQAPRFAVSPDFGTLGRAIVRRDLRGVADALPLYSNPHDPAVHEGLLRRRHAEAALFLKPIARFEDFTAEERADIISFDQLAGHTTPAARERREELRVRMRVLASQIEAAAQHQHDWDAHRRRDRYSALERRYSTKEKKA